MMLNGLFPELDTLLKQSSELDQAAEGFLLLPLADSSARLAAGQVMASMALEHSESLKALASLGNLISATSLLRLQYETIVRGVWLLYVAKDADIEVIQTDITESSEARAAKLPGLSQMLKDLEGRAPRFTPSRRP